VVDWVVERAHVTERPMTFSELTGFGRAAPGEEHNHEHVPGGGHEQQEAGT
jgi:hypothetical protein